MTRLRAAALAVVLLGMIAAPAHAGGHDGVSKDRDPWSGHFGRDHGLGARLDATLEQARAQFGDPGVQAVLIRNGRLLWSAERGARIRQPLAPVDKRTLSPSGASGS